MRYAVANYRVAQAREALALLKQLERPEAVSWAGEIYAINRQLERLLDEHTESVPQIAWPLYYGIVPDDLREHLTRLETVGCVQSLCGLWLNAGIGARRQQFTLTDLHEQKRSRTLCIDCAKQSPHLREYANSEV
jgi:hypothetical protein